MLCSLLVLTSLGQLQGQEEVLEGSLPTVVVQEERVEVYSDGQKAERFDSLDLQLVGLDNVGDLLQQSNSVFLRSYAPGGLSTASSRGTGYRHTAVLWNGFNLQSPMNGGNDLNLLPVFLMDDVQMSYGGGSALFGSGAIGGSLQLNNSPSGPMGQSGGLQLSAGSFQDLGQYAKYNIRTKRFASSLKAFHRQAQNDFRFRDQGQIRRQQQSHFQQFGLLQSLQYRLGPSQVVRAWGWYQNSDRQIPPNRTARNNREMQKDISLRLAAEWQYIARQGVIKSRAAFLDEQLDYSSDIVQNSASRTRSLDWQTEWDHQWHPKWRLNGGLQFIHRQAEAPSAFSSNPNRQQYALFGSLKTQQTHWSANLSIRQELVDGSFVPFTASLGGQYQAFKGWQLKGRAYRSYNLPTFNDLYWAGAGGTGNPNLEAESGWGTELGLALEGGNKWPWEQSLHLYSQWIDNWIQWLPSSGFNWEPGNLRSVWARGLEYQWKLGRQWGSTTWQFSTNYHLSLSSIHKTGPNESSALQGKQLIQTPLHSGSAQIRLLWPLLSITYTHLWTGKRFTTSDNAESQDAYQLATLRLRRRFLRWPLQPSASLHIHNLWDHAYEVVPLRPMPLRHFRLQLGIQF